MIRGSGCSTLRMCFVFFANSLGALCACASVAGTRFHLQSGVNARDYTHTHTPSILLAYIPAGLGVDLPYSSVLLAKK